MVNADKQDQALHALHRVLTAARRMALEAQPISRIAGVLDRTELLPRFLATREDQTAEYRDALEAITEKEPELRHALAAFDRDEPVRW